MFARNVDLDDDIQKQLGSAIKTLSRCEKDYHDGLMTQLPSGVKHIYWLAVTFANDVYMNDQFIWDKPYIRELAGEHRFHLLSITDYERLLSSGSVNTLKSIMSMRESEKEYGDMSEYLSRKWNQKTHTPPKRNWDKFQEYMSTKFVEYFVLETDPINL